MLAVVCQITYSQLHDQWLNSNTYGPNCMSNSGKEFKHRDVCTAVKFVFPLFTKDPSCSADLIYSRKIPFFLFHYLPLSESPLRCQ